MTVVYDSRFFWSQRLQLEENNGDEKTFLDKGKRKLEPCMYLSFPI